MAESYATTEELKAFMGRGVNVAQTNEEALTRALAAASRQIDAYTGWIRHGFWDDTAVTTRTYWADGSYCVNIPEGISTAAGLIVKVDYNADGTFPTTLTINTDFQLLPFDADDQSWPWTELGGITTSSNYFPPSTNGRAPVQITAKFGWPSVPAEVKEATLMQAVMIFKGPDAALGVASIGDSGIGMRVTSRIHPIAQGLIAPYMKPAVG